MSVRLYLNKIMEQKFGKRNDSPYMGYSSFLGGTAG